MMHINTIIKWEGNKANKFQIETILNKSHLNLISLFNLIYLQFMTSNDEKYI